MAILPIRQFGDPVLRQRAREVDRITRSHRRLVKDMFETMRAAPGVGLAANQVGVLDRVFVYEHEDDGGAFFNPVIVERSNETQLGEEGCLSIPGLAYEVERAMWVRIEGLDEKGRPQALEAEGYPARIFQHETDHLDGILFIERLPDDVRKEAMKVLRAQLLGLPTALPQMPARSEETL